MDEQKVGPKGEPHPTIEPFREYYDVPIPGVNYPQQTGDIYIKPVLPRVRNGQPQPAAKEVIPAVDKGKRVVVK